MSEILTTPPTFDFDNGITTVKDTEPLNETPDPNWNRTIQLVETVTSLDNNNTNYSFQISVTSDSTTEVFQPFFDLDNNLITVEINETAIGNVTTSVGNISSFQRKPQTDEVYVEVVKAGQKVGKVKHKLIYGDRGHH